MICAVIPARKNSKRILDKNIVKVRGKPLIQYTIDFCNNTDIFSEVFISTDCAKIAGFSSGLVSAPFLRPSELASDVSKDPEWLGHFIKWLISEKKHYSHVMILRPTSPIRPVLLIKKAIHLALSENSSLRSVTEIPKKMSPEWLISGCGKYGSEYIQNGFQIRSQDLQKYFYPNGLFDIVCIEHFLASNEMYGTNFLIQEVPKLLLNDIDTIEDLRNIEKQWEKLQSRASRA